MIEKKIFVVVPAHNAGAKIGKVFSRIPENVKHRIQRYVVVNDGSKDNTEDALMRLSAEYPNLVILRHQVNQGYGSAEKTLLNYALNEGADVTILLHSDGQYSPEKIPDLLKPFDEDRADIVQGSRILGGGALKGGMPIYKYVANRCLTAMENWAFGMKKTEYHSGYMGYSHRCLKAIPFDKLSDSFHFDLEMIVMAKIKGLRLMEVPIPTIYADEISYLNPILYGLDVLSVVIKYKRGKYHFI
jgi:glycosyltransferase involved in cell wall biosynthesis